MSDKKREQAKPPAATEPLKASRRIERGPEPERLKISGYAKWEDAAAAAVRARKPPGGWPKR